jgi:Ca2+:H+ antiporter
VESEDSSDIENDGSELSINNNSTTAVVESESSSGDTEGDEENEGSDGGENILGLKNSILWLTVITIFISMLSDLVVETIEKAAISLKVPSIFIAAIIVPIIGNAAEHAGAIMFAGKNRVNLTLGVALGSGTQIALMVLPFLVVVGWIEGRSLALDLGGTESLVYLFAVLLVTVALKDGFSNWLVGAVLMAAYGLVSICFWFHSPENIGAQNEI